MNLRQLATLELKENSGLTSMQKTGMNVIKHIFCYGKYFLSQDFHKAKHLCRIILILVSHILYGVFSFID